MPIPPEVWPFLGIFLLVAGYFYQAFDPTLYAHHHQPVFLVDAAYLSDFLEYPGGLADWGAQFFLQFLCFRLPGALILAAFSLAVFVLVYSLLRGLPGRRYPLLLACPPFLLFLMLQSHYGFPFVIGIKYFCAVALLLLYARLSGRLKLASNLLSALVYFALGGWGFLFYTALCVMHDTLYSAARWRYVHAVLGVLAYLAYPFLAARFLFPMVLEEAYFNIAPFERYQVHPGAPLYLLYLALPLLLLGHVGYVRLAGDRAVGKGMTAGRGWLAAQTAVIVAVGIGALVGTLDARMRKSVQVDQMATQGRWRELLDVSQTMTHWSRHTTAHTNRALYHTGQLLESMFNNPQLYGADGLFLDRMAMAGEITAPASDLYLELGHVKASQVMAYEGQTRQKYNPHLLKRLAVTNIICGQNRVAGMFLDVLEKSLVHRGWVRDGRNWLAGGAAGPGGALIESKRAQMPKTDFFIRREEPDRDLKKLLAADGQNRMALEYLLAYYLLERRLGDLGEFLALVYSEGADLPRHVEEALVLIKAAEPDALGEATFPVGSGTVQRFVAFSKLVEQNPHLNPPAAARLARERGFRTTYWYYAKHIFPRIRSRLSSRQG